MNGFQGTERLIYEFIIANATQLPQIPAKYIAAQTFSNTTSVNRVCKKMGYASYTQARFQIAHDQLKPTITEPSSCDQQPALNKLIQLLKHKSPVYLYGKGATITSLNYLSRFLSMANIPSLTVIDVHQLAQVQAGMIILISKSGETQSVVDMAHIAKQKRLHVASISPANSSLAMSSQLNLTLPKAGQALSLYHRESQIQTLMLIDDIGNLLLH